MAGIIQDLLDLELPYMFLVSVTFSIVCLVFTTFFFDQRNRTRDQHLKEVSLQPVEEEDGQSQEEQSESEISEEEDEDEKDDDSDEVKQDSQPMNEKDDGAGDEEVIGLMGQLKSARLKKIEEGLTEEQIKSEKETEREQLQAIFELLRKQERTMDMNPMDEQELKVQLSMYR